MSKKVLWISLWLKDIFFIIQVFKHLYNSEKMERSLTDLKFKAQKNCVEISV